MSLDKMKMNNPVFLTITCKSCKSKSNAGEAEEEKELIQERGNGITKTVNNSEIELDNRDICC